MRVPDMKPLPGENFRLGCAVLLIGGALCWIPILMLLLWLLLPE